MKKGVRAVFRGGEQAREKGRENDGGTLRYDACQGKDGARPCRSVNGRCAESAVSSIHFFSFQLSLLLLILPRCAVKNAGK